LGAFHFRGEFFGDWKSLQQTRQVRRRGLRAQPTEVGFAGLLARFSTASQRFAPNLKYTPIAFVGASQTLDVIPTRTQ
jgi:hypothetical protein